MQGNPNITIFINYNTEKWKSFMFSKRLGPTEVERRIWLPLKTIWPTSSETHQVVEI